jgi:biotin operon repressor
MLKKFYLSALHKQPSFWEFLGHRCIRFQRQDGWGFSPYHSADGDYLAWLSLTNTLRRAVRHESDGCGYGGTIMANNNIFDKLTGLWIPSEIMKLSHTTATQKMILGLAASFRNGLRLSNSQLATLLGIDRRNVIYNIQSLRRKGRLVDTGADKQHRVLIARVGDNLSPVSSDETPPVSQSGSDAIITTSSDASITSLAQSSDAVITHKQSNLNKPKNKLYSPNDDSFKLSELLFSEIRKRKPDFKKPNLQRWSAYVNRMIRFDKRKADRIAEVIRWCQNDSGNGKWGGWQNNILSTAKLREKFDKLELEMEKKDGSGKAIRNSQPTGQFIR